MESAIAAFVLGLPRRSERLKTRRDQNSDSRDGSRKKARNEPAGLLVLGQVDFNGLTQSSSSDKLKLSCSESSLAKSPLRKSERLQNKQLHSNSLSSMGGFSSSSYAMHPSVTRSNSMRSFAKLGLLDMPEDELPSATPRNQAGGKALVDDVSSSLRRSERIRNRLASSDVGASRSFCALSTSGLHTPPGDKQTALAELIAAREIDPLSSLPQMNSSIKIASKCGLELDTMVNQLVHGRGRREKPLGPTLHLAAAAGAMRQRVDNSENAPDAAAQSTLSATVKYASGAQNGKRESLMMDCLSFQETLSKAPLGMLRSSADLSSLCVVSSGAGVNSEPVLALKRSQRLLDKARRMNKPAAITSGQRMQGRLGFTSDEEDHHPASEIPGHQGGGPASQGCEVLAPQPGVNVVLRKSAGSGLGESRGLVEERSAGQSSPRLRNQRFGKRAGMRGINGFEHLGAPQDLLAYRGSNPMGHQLRVHSLVKLSCHNPSVGVPRERRESYTSNCTRLQDHGAPLRRSQRLIGRSQHLTRGAVRVDQVSALLRRSSRLQQRCTPLADTKSRTKSVVEVVVAPHLRQCRFPRLVKGSTGSSGLVDSDSVTIEGAGCKRPRFDKPMFGVLHSDQDPEEPLEGSEVNDPRWLESTTWSVGAPTIRSLRRSKRLIARGFVCALPVVKSRCPFEALSEASCIAVLEYLRQHEIFRAASVSISLYLAAQEPRLFTRLSLRCVGREMTLRGRVRTLATESMVPTIVEFLRQRRFSKAKVLDMRGAYVGSSSPESSEVLQAAAAMCPCAHHLLLGDLQPGQLWSDLGRFLPSALRRSLKVWWQLDASRPMLVEAYGREYCVD